MFKKLDLPAALLEALLAKNNEAIVPPSCQAQYDAGMEEGVTVFAQYLEKSVLSTGPIRAFHYDTLMGVAQKLYPGENSIKRLFDSFNESGQNEIISVDNTKDKKLILSLIEEMGVLLTDYSHTWSPELRKKYELVFKK